MNDREIPESGAVDYSDEALWVKIKRFALKAGKELIRAVLTLWETLQDADTPKWAKAVIIGVLAYFINPLDAIPDVTPVVGFSDDLGALVAAVTTLGMHIKPEHRQRAEERLKEWFGEEDDSGEPVLLN